MIEYFAYILISEVEEFMTLNNKKVLDVEGSRLESCQILNRERTCNAINLDPNLEKLIWKKTIIERVEKIPFKNNEFDLVINRGVIEHIPTEKHQLCINEMYRVAKKNGFCYLLVPMWYNFNTEHQLARFHLLPFKIAKFLRELFLKNKIKGNSLAEEDLFLATYNKKSRMISLSKFKIIATKDTHFRLHFITKIPYLRNVLVPDVAFILQK